MTPPAVIVRPVLAAFAKELRAARIRAGMSRHGLADKAGLTRYGLIKIESGRNVTLATIALLANALGCEVADFFPRGTSERA